MDGKRRQTKKIHELLAINIGSQQIRISNRLTQPPPIKRRNCLISTRAEHNRLKGEPTLMETRGVDQNISASDTKLTTSLSIDYINPLLVMDKLILGNSRTNTSPPKISLLLEVECTPAAEIIKPRLILAMNKSYLCWNKTFYKQRQMLIHYLNRIVSGVQMLRQGRSRIVPQTAVQLHWCLRKYLHENTQVRKSLCHRNGCRE